MYLASLNTAQLAQAHEAAGFLPGLPVRVDAGLRVKLGTLRAGLMAAVEALTPPDRGARRAARP